MTLDGGPAMAEQLAFGLHPADACEVRYMWPEQTGRLDQYGGPEWGPADTSGHPSTGHAHLWPGLPRRGSLLHHHRCDGCDQERGHLGQLPCILAGRDICWCDRRGPLPEARSTPGGARKGEARGLTHEPGPG